MKKKFLSMLIVSAVAVTAMGCSNNTNESSKSAASSNINVSVSDSSDESASADVKAKITLSNNSISAEGDGVEVVDKTITINSGGTYEVSGTLEDGQIIVDSADEINVYIVFNGVDISCSNSAPIYVKSAKNTIITLADNSENYLSDGSEYLYEELNDDGTVTDEPSACIFSKDDLTINGNGTLNVVGNYNNGIASKDDLKITAGTAVNNGLKGKDSITIKGGEITVNSTGDGVKSDNTEDTTKGYIIIEGGSLNITSGGDGIQAETTLTISDGDINIVSGGGSSNAATHAESFQMGPWANPSNTSSSSSSETGSAKALKAGTALTVDGGNINIDSADDSIHTNDTVMINTGIFHIKSGDDGIHADNVLEINGGDINITDSYEGLEAAHITVNDGNINLVASDDGINAAGDGIDSIMPSKTCQSVIISTPELVIGSSYSVYYGGNNSGSESNGLYTDGIATSGTELTNFTLSSSVMTVSSTGATEGVSGGMRAPGGMGGMQGGGRLPR